MVTPTKGDNFQEWKGHLYMIKGSVYGYLIQFKRLQDGNALLPLTVR